jgi:hypothetical protein
MAWSDSLKRSLGLLISPEADALGSYADDFDVAVSTVLTFDPDADALGSYSDSLTVGMKGFCKFAGPDSLSSWDDSLAGFLTHNVTFSDSLQNWSDVGWDANLSIVGGTTPVEATPAADDLNNWADDYTVEMDAYLNLVADDWNNWDDSAGATLGVIPCTFSASSSLNFWGDDLDVTRGIVTCIFTATDSMNNWGDSVGGFLTYSVDVTDTWGNLDDGVTVYKATLGEGQIPTIKPLKTLKALSMRR